MATAVATADHIGVISPGQALSLRALRAMGFGAAALRQMRRSGLPVRRCGRLSFVLSDDLLTWLREKADVIA